MRIERAMIKYWPRVLLCCMILPLCALLLFACSPGKKETAKPSDTPVQTTDVGKPEVDQPGEAGQRVEGELPTSNHPPVVDKARLKLESLGDSDYLKVIASGSDKDGDEVALNYEWTKNGQPLGGGDTISGFKRGDKITVKVIPSDGEVSGIPKTLFMEIKNTPPKIIRHSEAALRGNVYSYKVQASDPDGDDLTYSLKSSPSGMTINSKTGLIRWSVPDAFKGRMPATVVASDGNGGESVQNLTIEIQGPEKTK